MHRFAVTLMVAALLFSAVPAHAQTVNGFIMLPDFGTPAIARTYYTQTSTNGPFGYVFRVTTKGSFSLRTLPGGGTGVESFDIFFYDDASGKPGNALNPAYNTCPSQEITCDKAGAIPAGAKWGIITLVLGYNGTFRYVGT